MKVLFGSVTLAISIALLNLSWAGQGQDKQKKEKALDVGKGLELKGNLDNSLNMTYTLDDPKQGDPDKMSHQVFLVNFVKGKTYQIDMVKDEDSGMSPYVVIEDAKKKVLDQSGVGGKLRFTAPADGAFRIICTTVGGVGEGDYVLKVAETKGKN